MTYRTTIHFYYDQTGENGPDVLKMDLPAVPRVGEHFCCPHGGTDMETMAGEEYLGVVTKVTHWVTLVQGENVTILLEVQGKKTRKAENSNPEEIVWDWNEPVYREPKLTFELDLEGDD